MLRQWDVGIRHIPPGQPTINGIVERVNGVVKKLYLKYMASVPSSLSISFEKKKKIAQHIQLTINTTIHGTTGYTPFELHKGRVGPVWKAPLDNERTETKELQDWIATDRYRSQMDTDEKDLQTWEEEIEKENDDKRNANQESYLKASQHERKEFYSMANQQQEKRINQMSRKHESAVRALHRASAQRDQFRLGELVFVDSAVVQDANKAKTNYLERVYQIVDIRYRRFGDGKSSFPYYKLALPGDDDYKTRYPKFLQSTKVSLDSRYVLEPKETGTISYLEWVEGSDPSISQNSSVESKSLAVTDATFANSYFAAQHEAKEKAIDEKDKADKSKRIQHVKWVLGYQLRRFNAKITNQIPNKLIKIVNDIKRNSAIKDWLTEWWHDRVAEGQAYNKNVNRKESASPEEKAILNIRDRGSKLRSKMGSDQDNKDNDGIGEYARYEDDARSLRKREEDTYSYPSLQFGNHELDHEPSQ
jgi:hypothetical protein